MTEHSYKALMTAVFNRLRAEDEMWGQQVSEVVQPKWVRPYVQVYLISGGESNNLRAEDADYELGVKVVSDNQDEGLRAAARLSELLNDQGEQDLPTTALDGGSDWEITTSTQGRILHQVEMFSNALPIYHEGWVFSFIMGRRAS